MQQSVPRETARVMSSFHYQTSDIVFWKEPKESVTNHTVPPIPATPVLTTSEVHLVGQVAPAETSSPCNCDLCEMIIATSKSEWVFGWLRKLRSWEKALQYEDKCHQLSFNLVSEGTIDIGSRVRDKLGILQTEMVNLVNICRCCIS
jgi:hypothetical protein